MGCEILQDMPKDILTVLSSRPRRAKVSDHMISIFTESLFSDHSPINLSG